MWYRQLRARREQSGFTLVELLAVIAIIGILAAIVVPRVTRYIARARVTRAVAEIKNVETSLTGVLTATSRSNFRDMLTQAGRDQLDTWSADIMAGQISGVIQAQAFYNQFFYELLRQGKNSDFIKTWVDPEVRQKIGSTAIDIGLDPWGQQYNFWMGPTRGPVPLRSYRVANSTYDAAAAELDDPNFSTADAYVYGVDAYTYELSKLPGQPSEDESVFTDASGPFSPWIGQFPNFHAYGFPAPRDVEVYVWSNGPNLRTDAHVLTQLNLGVDQSDPAFLGGGDDPNSWDNEQGWDDAPKV